MVEPGRIAICHYTGRIVDGDEVGEPFDTTDVDLARESGIYHDDRDYKPLQIRVGEGEVLPGVETALLDLEADPDALPVETTMRLEPDEAFGEHDGSQVVEIPVDEIDDSGAEGSLEPETPVHTDDGKTGWVTDVGNETAIVDFNHELAGVPVEIELEVLEVRDERTKSE
ncbi:MULTISPECIES: FKBP-type peptidyl-prolyl cis-trans isomerase [Natrialbaceae]|uniref:FKBP-type peptidyl-prolyl cis-trans isomerase n=1 Tax=Natrialbaceae TaxID=1644061 RepID=UPI00207CF9D5|nr:FKBP-type peptidyl-prolyl cis-trans isomerase [Natronococcus sp. CG52]